MGLSIVVSGAIVLLSMFFVLSAFPVIAENTFYVSQGSTEISHIEAQIIHTNIDISDVTASPDSQDITVDLDNIGNRKLWNYGNFDFIVTYDAQIQGQKIRTTEHLTFGVSCPPISSQWCIQSISPDDIDSEILNSKEIAVLDARLSNQIHSSGGLVIVTISTDNGVTATNSVTV